MASTIFSNLDTALLTPILNFVNTTATGVSSWATGPLAIAFTIYVMVQGGSILLGKTSDPLAEFLVSCVRYGLILTLIGSAGRQSEFCRCRVCAGVASRQARCGRRLHATVVRSLAAGKERSMKRWMVTMLGCGALAVSIAGCASMNNLRYPLPEPS